MATVKSRFGPYLPDQPVFGAEGSRMVKNALPVKGGYAPAKQVVGATEPVPEKPLASIFVKSSTGTSFGFVGGPSRLFRGTGLGFVDGSRSGGYQAPFDDTWSFTRFADQVYASNFSDPIQKFDLLADTSFDSLDGDAPRARFLAVVNRFLVVAYLNEDGTISSTGVRWSGLDTPDIFPDIDINTNIRSDDAISTLSDRQLLAAEYGEITGVVTGLSSADALIFQRGALTAMNFTGGEEIFSFDVLEGARGAIANGSIVQEGGKAYYISDTGLYVTDGVTSTAVGDRRVDDFIFQTLRLDRLSEIRSGISVRSKIIYWFIPGFQDITLVYNYSIDEFSFLEDLGVTVFTRALTSAQTAEAIATSFDGSDNMPVSFDDPQFSGSDIPVFSAFGQDNRLGPLSGNTLAAVLRTPEVEAFDDGRGYLQFTRPLIDTERLVVVPVTRETLQEQPEPRGGFTVAAGEAQHRQTARYWALQIQVEAGAAWTFAQGIQAVFERAGNREPGNTPVTFDAPPYLFVRGYLHLMNSDGQPLLTEERVEPVVVSVPLVTQGGDFLVTQAGVSLVTQA